MSTHVDAKLLAQKTGMPYLDLARTPPDQRCVELLKEVFARSYRSIPVRFLNGGVLVAMEEPAQNGMIEAITFHMGHKVYPALADKAAIQAAIDNCYSGMAAEEAVDAPPQVVPEVSREHHTISVISNKGGVGKTHISTNLAKILSDHGRKVLLIDADLGNADISNKLAMFPEHTLMDFLEGEISLKEIIMPTALGFDLIGGSSGEFRLANINYVQRSKFIRNFNKISQDYDVTIFDLSAGIGSAVMDFALATDEVVVVTTPQDIIAGYACIKASFQHFKSIEDKLMSKVEDYEPRRVYVPWVVMNQVTTLKQGIFLYNRICQTADERVNNAEDLFAVKPAYLGGVLYDRELFRKAEQNRQPLSGLFPRSKPAQCLEFLGRNIMTRPSEREYRSQVRGGIKRFAAIFSLR